MKKLNFVVIAVSLLAGLLMTPAAQAAVNDASLDILVLAGGSTDALVQQIQAVGGTVKLQYRNVAVVAATIPADMLGAVARFPGVTRVEEDGIAYLEDGPQGSRDERQRMSLGVVDMAGVAVHAVDPAEISSANIEPSNLPQGYADPWFYTGAYRVWPETSGAGSIVAVVDSGTARNACLAHAVIGAPGYPDGYNATGDGIPATSSLNNFHGTYVSGVIASACYMDFSGAPDTLVYLAQKPYLGWPVNYMPLYGQAPGAQIYPVKVFPYPGISAPTSMILDGLDHVLTLKKAGLLDIDIVNMSIGGVTMWDGRDAYDRFLEALNKANILVVTSAGNVGPIPNSVSSPATSFGTLSVGALDYAPSSRVYYEALGLVYLGTLGQGMVMRPTSETRVVSYSGRGPLSDGRSGPEIVALGHETLYVGPKNELSWAEGTSFAAPAVAGAAALLNAWWEAQGHETDPTVLENTLLLGANQNVVGAAWRGVNEQGYGALDVPAAFEHLKFGNWRLQPANGLNPLTANVLGEPVRGKVQTWESQTIELAPGEPLSTVFQINQWTSKVTIEVYDIAAPDNSTYAVVPNALEVHVQSAKRTSFPHPVARTWYPCWYGGVFQIVIEDGPWTSPWGQEANQPMEPGLMKLSLGGADWNEAPVSFKVRIVRENFRAPLQNRIANGVIKMGDVVLVPVNIPPGTTRATFDLVWRRDWSMFPTTHASMFIYDPDRKLASTQGARSNAPEHAVIASPVAGTWYVRIRGYTAFKPDNYDLYLTLD